MELRTRHGDVGTKVTTRAKTTCGSGATPRWCERDARDGSRGLGEDAGCCRPDLISRREPIGEEDRTWKRKKSGD